ncbi:MAG: hypothetical protein ACRCX7_11435 [Cetobacterium sp.]|uniref:hypothetical protein n=1 Tax=Cetobacterium sp. TaxID=2071632 RepID=UPI003F39A0B1
MGRRYAKCIDDNQSYVTDGHYYEVISQSGVYIEVLDNDGDENTYHEGNFDYVKELKYTVGDWFIENDVARIRRVTGTAIERSGPVVHFKNTYGFGESISIDEITKIDTPDFSIGDRIVCEYDNKIGDTGNIRLTKGKSYTIKDVRNAGNSLEVNIRNDNDSSYWYSSFRFRKSTLSEKIKEYKDMIDIDDTFTIERAKSLPNTNTNKNAEATEEKKMTITKTTNTMTNKLMDKFGTFGKIEGVALTMTGKMAVVGMDGNYYSYEDGVLVSNDDMVFDGFPGFAMPVMRSTLKSGDIILDKEKGFLFVSVDKNLISYDGTIHTVAKQSHAMFGNSMDFVSKVMDMGGMMNGTSTTTTNPFSNPLMMMMLMKDDKGTGGSMDKMMEMMIMTQMMGGNQANSDNPMANMMPMMMFMGKDGGNNDMMKTMFMFQMMQNQQKADK